MLFSVISSFSCRWLLSWRYGTNANCPFGIFRTMIWAIDLDDGTLINALGSDLSRPKSDLTDPLTLIPDFETRFQDL